MASYPYEAALFDLDGVLIDSEGSYTLFWDRVGREYGKPSTFANDIKGSTLTTILTAHFAPNQHPALEKAIHDYEDSMLYPLFEGVMEFLLGLQRLGVPMAIVTSSDDKKMEALGRQRADLLELMHVVIDGSMVKHSKPHPEGYLTAAGKLGKRPERCVVFEDSLQGLEAGLRAGCKVVGLTTTNPAEKVKPLCDLMLAGWLNVNPLDIGF